MHAGFRRATRRERVFRDRENRLEIYNDDELYIGRRNLLFIFGLLKIAITHQTKNIIGASTTVINLLTFFGMRAIPNCGSTVLYRNGVVPELHREKGLPRRDKGMARLIMADWAAR